jgi:hypothetical protein
MRREIPDSLAKWLGFGDDPRDKPKGLPSEQVRGQAGRRGGRRLPLCRRHAVGRTRGEESRATRERRRLAPTEPTRNSLRC